LRAKLGFTDFSEEEHRALPPVHRSLVRAHPGAGRKALYLGAHASHIVDWPVPDGRMLQRRTNSANSPVGTAPQHVGSGGTKRPSSGHGQFRLNMDPLRTWVTCAHCDAAILCDANNFDLQQTRDLRPPFCTIVSRNS
jgi:hypothetical protein